MIEHFLQPGISYFQDQAYLDALIEFELALQQSGEQAIVLGWRGRTLSQMAYYHLDNQRQKLSAYSADTWITSTDPGTWYGHCHREV